MPTTTIEAFTQTPLQFPFPLKLTLNEGETILEAVSHLYLTKLFTKGPSKGLVDEWVLLELVYLDDPKVLESCLISPPEVSVTPLVSFGSSKIALPLRAVPTYHEYLKELRPLITSYLQGHATGHASSPPIAQNYFNAKKRAADQIRAIKMKSVADLVKSKGWLAQAVTLKGTKNLPAGTLGVLTRIVTPQEHIDFELVDGTDNSLVFTNLNQITPSIQQPVPANLAEFVDHMYYSYLPAQVPSQYSYEHNYLSKLTAKEKEPLRLEYERLFELARKDSDPSLIILKFLAELKIKPHWIPVSITHNGTTYPHCLIWKTWPLHDSLKALKAGDVFPLPSHSVLRVFDPAFFSESQRKEYFYPSGRQYASMNSSQLGYIFSNGENVTTTGLEMRLSTWEV